MNRAILLATLSLAIGLFASASTAALDAQRLADRMLAALGGRAAWANAKNTVNDSRQDWDGDPSE